jgi:phage gp36-like protein
MNNKHIAPSSSSSKETMVKIKNEFSRIVDSKKLLASLTTVRFSATESEKQALAQRFGILAIKDFSAVCKIDNRPTLSSIKVDAILSARVVQACVVTLHEVHETVCEQVTLYLVSPKKNTKHIVDNFENNIEEIALDIDGTLDLGEILVQYLILALNPYPKSQKVSNL